MKSFEGIRNKKSMVIANYLLDMLIMIGVVLIIWNQKKIFMYHKEIRLMQEWHVKVCLRIDARGNPIRSIVVLETNDKVKALKLCDDLNHIFDNTNLTAELTFNALSKKA